ncbi:MAG: hypothetical protein GH143_07140 [Calditrichaeota bacterium]|nr:hypothetical protein [Calditrichota bacterium]
MKKKTSLVLAALAGGSLLLTPLQGQGLHLKGQLWGSFTYGDDPAPEHTRREATLGYIPTFSLARQLGPLSVVDLEAAYYWGRVTDGPFETSGTGSVDTEKWYRLWGRIATEKLELRLGLQKIAFGPARVLRPLMWFDTFDLKDPTGQTEGVAALRLKWYPWPNLALWGWAIRPDHPDEASAGGRAEYTFGPGEVALTYHYQQRTSLDFGGKSLLLFDEAENRLALDTRLDWIIGLWSEVVLAQATEEFMDGVKNDLLQVMVGGDYTFPWGDGVYVTVEHLWSRMDYYELPPPWS